MGNNTNNNINNINILKLNSNDYDLNLLFNYDILKQVLVNLTKNQSVLFNEIASLKSSSDSFDFRLKPLEEKYQKDELAKKDQVDDLSNHNSQHDSGQRPHTGSLITKIRSPPINTNDISNNQNLLSQNIISTVNNNIVNNNSPNNSNQQSPISQDMIRNLLKSTRENKNKISNLENQLTTQMKLQFKKTKEDFNKIFDDKTFQYSSLLKNFETKLNDLIQKNSENEQRLEDCMVKCANCEIYQV